MSTAKSVEIANGIYWVGSSDQDGGLNCNPYLLVDGDEAVLIDPGSVLDFEQVLENVCSIVPLEKIKYVILHHQDPDFCASVPLFEQRGAKFEIVTHWRTASLVKYYGIKSDYYIVNKNDFKLVLKSGRVLGFIQTPYLHFPGAITTYDYNSKILFSSDLFGAFSYEWSLFAGEDYIEKMKTFHEHYMPSNDIIRPVMEAFLNMDISIIAPQHGSIIKDNISMYIKVLRDLECGTFLTHIKRNIAKSGGYRTLITSILKRYASIFSKEAVMEVIGNMDITFDYETMEITDYNYTGNTLWNLIFEEVMARKGMQWILIIEPMVNKLAKEYDLPIPEVFQTMLKKAEEETINLTKENALLKEINERLSNSLRETQEKLVRCPVTGLYNYEFFRNYISMGIKELIDMNSEQNPGLIIIGIDNMAKIRYSYGDNEVTEVLRNIVYTVNAVKGDNSILFRLHDELFACYIPHITKEDAVIFAEKLRNTVVSSDKFIEKITVSIGVLCLNEIIGKNLFINDPGEQMYNIAIMRLKLAKSMGMNIVCSSSSVENYQEEIGKILIIDNDAVNIDILKTFLENLNYKVIIAGDGFEALKILEKDSVNLIISEIMIPKIDGFQVRERLMSQSQTKNITFILLSHLKNEDSVKRAASLGIEYYFQKPFMLSELLGIIKNKVKGEEY